MSFSKNDMLSLLRDLVAIPSVSTDIDALHTITSFVEKQFTSFACARIHKHIYNKKPSILIQNFDGLHADIVLCGHLDVVPADHNQFALTQKDGLRYGRWASDMKDGCAMMIFLMKEIVEKKYTDKRISLWLTTDEEVGWYDGVEALIKDGYGGDVIMIPDSGSLQTITHASKGIITIKIALEWKAVHSSKPWAGTNALEQIYLLYDAIKKQWEDSDNLYDKEKNHWWTSVQLTMLSWGKATNIIPWSATCAINIRCTTENIRHDILQNIESLVQSFGWTIQMIQTWPVMWSSPDNKNMQIYKNIAEEILWPVLYYKEHGTTDGRFFPDTSLVIMQQAKDHGIHSENECVDLDEVMKIYEVWRHFIFAERKK